MQQETTSADETATPWKHSLSLALRFFWFAAIYRYRDGRFRGPLFLGISVLDVLLYAAVISAVTGTVFALGGVDRFVPTLVGLIALRWSLSCAIQASRTAHFAQTHRLHAVGPMTGGVILAVAAPTLIFAVSVALLVAGLVVSLRAPSDLFHMLGWGLLAAGVQFVWNCVLALVVIHARLRQFLLSEVPIVLGFVLLLIVSPVAYQFSDIPAAASRLLTSLNPASHLIAGYQNAFWYMQGISLEVLPWAGVVGVLLMVVLGIAGRRLIVPQAGPTGAEPTFLRWNGSVWLRCEAFAADPNIRWVSRWQGELPWITGKSFLYLIERVQGTPSVRARIFAQLTSAPDVERVLGSPLPLLSHSNRDRLGAAIALGDSRSVSAGHQNVVSLEPVAPPFTVMDGLFDHADASEIDALNDILTEEGIASIGLVTYRRRIAEVLALRPAVRGLRS